MALADPDDAVVTRVSSLAAAASRPVLTAEEVKASILAHPVPDRNGVTVEMDGWEPTWNIPLIVSELWGMKAGKVAGDFNFGADGSNFSKGEVMANCLAMEAQWAAKVTGGVATGLASGDDRWMTDRLMPNG